MTNENLKNLIAALTDIAPLPISFCGTEIEICDVLRAKHSDKWRIAPHIHPWFEFNYVQKGSLFTTLADREFFVEKGQSFIIPPGVPHSHRHNRCGDDGLCIRFRISGEASAEIMPALCVPRPEAFDSEIEMLLDAPQNTTALRAAFVCWLTRLCGTRKADSAPIAAKPQKAVSKQVTLWLEEFFAQPVCVSDIAAAMGMSYRSLSRKFKAETGCTISDRLSEIRISAAKRLLSESNMPMREIALSAGFESEYYFSAAFKKKVGVSPLAYRKTHKSAYFTH